MKEREMLQDLIHHYKSAIDSIQRYNIFIIAKLGYLELVTFLANHKISTIINGSLYLALP
jgi:hypothetical protein